MRWPDKSALVQTALTAPDAGAIPDQCLDPGAAPITKYIGCAVTGCAPKTLLDAGGEAVDADAHIDGFDG